MKRPVLLVVGAVAGALMIAGVGVSAHTGLSHRIGVTSSLLSDEASSPRTETPEPKESPEATEPAENETATDEDTDEDTDIDEDVDDNATKAATTPKSSGEHESGDKVKSSSGAEKEKD